MALFHESTALIRAIVVDEYLTYANWCCSTRPTSCAKTWRSEFANAIYTVATLYNQSYYKLYCKLQYTTYFDVVLDYMYTHLFKQFDL